MFKRLIIAFSVLSALASSARIGLAVYEKTRPIDLSIDRMHIRPGSGPAVAPQAPCSPCQENRRADATLKAAAIASAIVGSTATVPSPFAWRCSTEAYHWPFPDQGHNYIDYQLHRLSAWGLRHLPGGI